MGRLAALLRATSGRRFGIPRARSAATLSAVAIVGLGATSGLPAAAGAASHPSTGRSASRSSAAGWADPAAVPVAVSDHAAATGAGQAAGSRGGARVAGSVYRQIVLPDLLVVAPNGLTSRQVARLQAISGVRQMITFDGARITAGGRSVNVIGVDPSTFRSWVPLRTATDNAFWAALSRGDFVASATASQQLRLRPGAAYKLAGGTTQVVTFGASARLGVTGIDLLVNQAMSARLGLVRHVAALISAPGASLATLTRAVSAVLGPAGKIETLRSEQLPVSSPVPSGTLPASYLQLFQASAARYCPGLSWTVLAAIGQIESADGTNEGPSTAGALGPMQFLPSTWAVWGIDGFGQTGPPNVLNPYDAVPSAARLLCADGAAAGGSSLYNAIFDYNHAGWYVREVLGLAAEYAADYH